MTFIFKGINGDFAIKTFFYNGISIFDEHEFILPFDDFVQFVKLNRH